MKMNETNSLVPHQKNKAYKLLSFWSSLALLSLSFVHSVAIAAVIPPNRTTQVVLGPASPDGNSLLVNPGGILNVPNPPFASAVRMDGGTSILNYGLIRLTGEDPNAATLITDNGGGGQTVFTGIYIRNYSTGNMQWIANNGALGPLMDFRFTTSPLVVVNEGTITGSRIIGGASTTGFNGLSLTNIGTLNVSLNAGPANVIDGAGSIFINNSGLFNLNGDIFSQNNVTIVNSGIFDYSNPGALGLNPTGNINIKPTGNLIINNSGTMGFNAPVFNITPTGDLQLINSGIMGSLVAFPDGLVITPGAGPNGSSIVNTPTGRIANANQAPIDFSNTTAPSSLINQGVILGGITAGSNVGGPTTITVGGPTSMVIGDITADSSRVNNQLNIVGNFNFNNNIAGISGIAVQGGIFNFNTQGGASTNAISNFNTFTVAQGATATLAGLIEGSEQAILTNNGTLNFNTANIFVPGGITNNGTLNINNIGSPMIINGGITNNGRLNLFNDITLFRPSSLLNNGIVAVVSPQTITGDYFQTAGGIFSTTLVDLNNYGRLTVAGNTSFTNNAIVQVLLANNNTVQVGDFFDVIVSGNALPGASSFLIDSSQGQAADFVFTPLIVNGNTLRLLIASSRREPIQYASTVTTPNEQTIASVFDLIRANPQHNPDFDQFFVALDNLTPEARQEAFNSISPDAYAPAAAASFGAQMTFINKITALLDLQRQATLDVNKRGILQNGLHKGYAAGDMQMLDGRFSLSPIYYTNNQSQKDHDSLPGYRATTNGFGLLWDGCVNPVFRLGVGVAAANTDVKAGFRRNKKNDINSYQGVLYGSYEEGPTFIDGILTLAYNHNRAKHNIFINRFHFYTQARYNASQYALRMRAGYGIPFYCFEVQPLLTAFMTQVNQAAFTQRGAQVLNMQIDARNNQKIQGGMGVKFAYNAMPDCFVPEVHVLYLHDFKNSTLRTTGGFVGDGPAFNIRGSKIPRNGVNAGLSLTAMITDDLMLIGGYDLEKAKRFRSNYGSLRARWLF